MAAAAAAAAALFLARKYDKRKVIDKAFRSWNIEASLLVSLPVPRPQEIVVALVTPVASCEQRKYS